MVGIMVSTMICNRHFFTVTIGIEINLNLIDLFFITSVTWLYILVDIVAVTLIVDMIEKDSGSIKTHDIPTKFKGYFWLNNVGCA